jgi:methylsterol monooxygenase
MGRLVYRHRQPCYCDRVDELFASRGGASLDSTRSSVFTSQCQIVYFGRALPWIIIDAIPYFRKWKLQPGKVPTPQEQWECTKLVLFSHFTVELPVVRSSQTCVSTYGPVSDSNLDMVISSTCRSHRNGYIPGPSTIMENNASSSRVFLLFRGYVSLLLYTIPLPSPHRNIFILFRFTAHQALHTGVLYKHIHKIHHKYSAPFGLAAEYAHPAEVFILGTGTILGPLLYCYFMRDLHICTVYVWIFLRLCQAIDAHSGYGGLIFVPRYIGFVSMTSEL